MTLRPSIVVELIHIHGPMKGKIDEFSVESVSIGRHPSCTVRFPSDLTSVSRKHAEIIRAGNQFKLIDHSSNGTYLNGRKVAEAYLKDGDVLEFSERGPKVSFITKVEELPKIKPSPVTQHEDLDIIREEIVLDKPIKFERSQPVQGENTPPPAPAHLQPALVAPSSPQQPILILSDELPTGKVIAPLVIQYGPSLRSYSELPVTLGSNPACDFVFTHPSILMSHAQIIFARGQYWIKDLTGQSTIRVNNNPVPFQAALNVNDLISLASDGPAFCYLGEGRIAEAAESVDVSTSAPDNGRGDQQKSNGTETAEPEGLWEKLKKRF